MSKRHDWSRRSDETLKEWAERLEQVDVRGLTDHQRAVLNCRRESACEEIRSEEEDARRWGVLSGRPSEPAPSATTQDTQIESGSAIESIKREIRSLTVEERQQVVLWIAQGMPSD
jgi:hypothetical protein